MYFLKELTHTIQLEPKKFGPNLENEVRTKLFETVEGSCVGEIGYIIEVVDIIDVGEGTLMPTYGYAVYNIRYNAVVFKPFRNEVLDASVINVNKMGFFAVVGPLNVFVSNHLIPLDLQFDPNSNPPAFVSEDQSTRIRKSSAVRLRVVGLKIEARHIVSEFQFLFNISRCLLVDAAAIRLEYDPDSPLVDRLVKSGRLKPPSPNL